MNFPLLLVVASAVVVVIFSNGNCNFIEQSRFDFWLTFGFTAPRSSLKVDSYFTVVQAVWHVSLAEATARKKKNKMDLGESLVAISTGNYLKTTLKLSYFSVWCLVYLKFQYHGTERGNSWWYYNFLFAYGNIFIWHAIDKHSEASFKNKFNQLSILFKVDLNFD